MIRKTCLPRFKVSCSAAALVLGAAFLCAPLSPAHAGSGGGGYGAISGGGTAPTAEAEKAQLEAEIAAAKARMSAISVAVTPAPTGGACVGEIECSRWLQQEYKRILLKLLSTYYALGTDGKNAAPVQAEIVANLTANVISLRR